MKTMDYFYIRRPNGVVTGPFAFVVIERMRAQGRLHAEDQLSVDREHWFGAFEESARSGVGAQTPDAPSFPEPSAAPGEEGADVPPLRPSPSPVPERFKDAQPKPPQQAKKVEKLPQPTLSELIAMALSSVWDGPRYYKTLEQHLKVLRVLTPVYSLCACLLGWLLFPPVSFSLAGSGALCGAVLGLVMFLGLCAVACADPVLCCLLCWRRFHWDVSVRVAVWLSLLRNSTFCGATVLLWHAAKSDSLWRVLPCVIIVALLVWNEACHVRIMHEYVHRRLDERTSYWFIGVFMTMMSYLELVLFMTIYFGGKR